MSEQMHVTMALSRWASRILLLATCLCAGSLAHAGEDVRPSSLDSPKYDRLKAEFLNVDPAYFSEVVFSNHFGDTSQDFSKSDGDNLLELKIDEGVHRPNWDSTYDTNERWGRRFAPAGITLQEVGRMRMTSYAIRTWLGTAEEVANKEALLETMRYPSPESICKTQAAWNQDKPDNPRLIRNTPDFRMALRKLAARSRARK